MSINKNACFTSTSDHYKTPSELYNALMDMGFLDLFPFHADYDEFEMKYANKNLFINPPYSIFRFMESWLYDNILMNNITILLVPVRTDTKVVQSLFNLKPLIFFFSGRLHFNESKSAPFPSMALVFAPSFLRLNEYEHGTIHDFLCLVKLWVSSYSL